MKRIFYSEFRRGFVSKNLYLSIFFMLGVGLISSIDILKYLIRVEVFIGEPRFLGAAYHVLSSEVFAFVIPVASTLAMSASFIADVQSGMMYSIIIRTKKKEYWKSVVSNCAFFGFITIVLTSFLFIVLFFIIFFPNTLEMQALKGAGILQYSELIQRIFILGLNGSFYSILGGMVAVISDSKYMAHAAPFIFYYVISTLMDAYLINLYYINPKEWLVGRHISPSVVMVVMGIMNIVCIICYFKIIERRWHNE